MSCGNAIPIEIPHLKEQPLLLRKGLLVLYTSNSLYSESFFQLGNMNLFFHLNACNLLIIIFISLLSYNGFTRFFLAVDGSISFQKSTGSEGEKFLMQLSYCLDENFLMGQF